MCLCRFDLPPPIHRTSWQFHRSWSDISHWFLLHSTGQVFLIGIFHRSYFTFYISYIYIWDIYHRIEWEHVEESPIFHGTIPMVFPEHRFSLPPSRPEVQNCPSAESVPGGEKIRGETNGGSPMVFFRGSPFGKLWKITMENITIFHRWVNQLFNDWDIFSIANCEKNTGRYPNFFPKPTMERAVDF